MRLPEGDVIPKQHHHASRGFAPVRGIEVQPRDAKGGILRHELRRMPRRQLVFVPHHEGEPAEHDHDDAQRDQRSATAPCHLRSYRIFPPRMVRSTTAVRISGSGTLMMSLDSTTTSASLPGVSEPFSCSSNAAYAPFSV